MFQDCQYCKLWSFLAVWMRWWGVYPHHIAEAGQPYDQCQTQAALSWSPFFLFIVLWLRPVDITKWEGACLEKGVRTNTESNELCTVQQHLKVDKWSFLTLEVMTNATLNWFCLSKTVKSWPKFAGKYSVKYIPWELRLPIACAVTWFAEASPQLRSGDWGSSWWPE